jgi:large subunit ribosomal protein L24
VKDMVRSSQPRKQRKAAGSAPTHSQRKRVRARLQLEDNSFTGVRNITVRAGDTVKVVRGDFGFPNSKKSEGRGKRNQGKRGASGVEGEVLKVNPDGTLHIEGIAVTKSDGKDEPMPVRASNVVVIKLDDSDAKRMSKLAERENRGA